MMKNFLRFLTMLAVLTFFVGNQLSAQTILCVDRDFDDTGLVFTDTWPMIQEALDANGYEYEYWEVLEPTDDGPDADYMGNFDIVIWFTGEAWTDGYTMGENDEFNLLLYLNVGGGKLFMNAQDYLYDRYPDAGTFNPGEFPYDQLGLIEVVQDVYHIEPLDPNAMADSASFVGSPGSLAEGLEFQVADIFSLATDEGLYGDSIAEHMGQNMLGIIDPYISEGPAAIQYETATFRSVFTTIDIASVQNIDARDTWMYRIVDWLMYGSQGISDLQPDDVDLLISPNPVRDFMNIGMMEKMEEISIYNSQGQLMVFEKVNKGTTRMDLGSLPAGIYILKVKTAKGLVTDKIIKQ